MDPRLLPDSQWKTATSAREKEPSDFEIKGGGEEDPLQPTNGSIPIIDRRIYDITLLFGIIVMLWWPWIFWGLVSHRQGVQLSDRAAKLVIDHPSYVSFFGTLVGNLVALIVDVFFSLAIVRFAQEWIVARKNVTVFQVSILSAFRYQSWPWLLKDMKVVLGRKGWFPALLVGVCISAFAFVTSSTTTLLTPVPFNKTITLTGSELDFSSTESQCIQFFDTHPFAQGCDWRVKSNVSYTTCLGATQLTDVLESGRINMLSLLPDSSETLTLTQFGNKPGLRYQGPSRGILPIGPNSPVPTLDTLQHTPISDVQARAAMPSYNYTLELQGLSTNVSCKYDVQNPIIFQEIKFEKTVLSLQYDGTCQLGQLDLFNTTILDVNSNNGLGYWACKSRSDLQQEQQYFAYLRGRSNYTQVVGNMTCTISPIQLGVYPVAYQPQAGVFSVEEPISTTKTMYHDLVDASLTALLGVIHESQNWEASTVTESIFTSAIRYFGLRPHDKSPQHLRLYEAMIQGMLEYEMAYLRLIYSMVEDPPALCFRTVRGTADLQVVGWFAKMEHIGFLMPMTFINLASLILMTIVLTRADGRGYDFDPTEMRRLLVAEIPEGQRSDSDVWDSKVEYQGGHQIPTSDSR